MADVQKGAPAAGAAGRAAAAATRSMKLLSLGLTDIITIPPRWATST